MPLGDDYIKYTFKNLGRWLIMFNISLFITLQFYVHSAGIISFFLSHLHLPLAIIFFLSYLASTDSYGSTSNAFIFSLINKEGLAPFKSMVNSPSNAIYRSPSYGLTFGGGHDISIKNNANSNTNSYTSFGNSYSVPSGVQDRRTILAGTYSFSPDEVEVFYLGWVTWNGDQAIIKLKKLFTYNSWGHYDVVY